MGNWKYRGKFEKYVWVLACSRIGNNSKRNIAFSLYWNMEIIILTLEAKYLYGILRLFAMLYHSTLHLKTFSLNMSNMY